MKITTHLYLVPRLRLRGAKPLLPRGVDMTDFNPLNAELNPICHLLTLLEAHHILHVSRVRVKLHLLMAVNSHVES